MRQKTRWSAVYVELWNAELLLPQLLWVIVNIVVIAPSSQYFGGRIEMVPFPIPTYPHSRNAAFTGDLRKKEVHRAITLHPVKQHRYQHHVLDHFYSLSIEEANFKIINLKVGVDFHWRVKGLMGCLKNKMLVLGPFIINLNLLIHLSEYCGSWESFLVNRLPPRQMLMRTIKVLVSVIDNLSVAFD